MKVVRSVDDNGFPVLLAEAPAEEPVEEPSLPIPSRSQASVASDLDELELSRRWDAVRDAAREFDDMHEGDARDFLAGRALHLPTVDIPQFLDDVRRVRIDDIVDSVDHRMRKSGKMMTMRRKVRLEAPRGWVNRSIKKLSDDELHHVVHRLKTKGHSSDDALGYVASKLKSEKRSATLTDRLAGDS